MAGTFAGGTSVAVVVVESTLVNLFFTLISVWLVRGSSRLVYLLGVYFSFCFVQASKSSNP